MQTITRYLVGNELLAAFPSDVVDRFEHQLQLVELKTGETLFTAGTLLRHAYFPVSAVVSLFSPLQDGEGAEIAVVGREGVVGVGTFMGTGKAVSSAVVMRSGSALRIGAAQMAAMARHEEVMRPLLRYVQVLFSTMAQTSACHAHHCLYQQLCSWLLQHLDRQEDDDLYITQERISGMLGVRRESVTECALKLQRKGVITYQRGLIRVIDRGELERESCECYDTIDRSLGTLGVHQHATV